MNFHKIGQKFTKNGTSHELSKYVFPFRLMNILKPGSVLKINMSKAPFKQVCPLESPFISK